MSNKSQTDLEQLIDIVDKALTSKDERVVNALRSLMMITLLTNVDDKSDSVGPLRQLFESMDNLRRRMSEMEYQISRLERSNNDVFKWPKSNSGTDYYFDAVTAAKINAGYDPSYGAIPPLTAQSIADLTKTLK